MRIRPESRDGYYAVGTPVEIEAVPGGGRAFVRWDFIAGLLRRSDRGSRWSFPGESSNPATGPIGPWGSTGSEYAARFIEEPLFLIDSEVDGIEILVNGETKGLPWAFPAGAHANGTTVEAPAVVPDETGAGDDVRYRFDSWSDGGDHIHRLAIPATGGTVSLKREARVPPSRRCARQG